MVIKIYFDLQVCDSLLSHKAFINSKSRVGRTALHLAAMMGYANLCKYVVSIYIIINLQKYYFVKLSINVSFRFLVTDHNAVIDILTLKKQTPLHLAAAAGQLEVCKLLLELGANIDATDDRGQKPIHVAAQNNYPEVAQLFLQQQHSLVMATTKVCYYIFKIIMLTVTFCTSLKLKMNILIFRKNKCLYRVLLLNNINWKYNS